MLDRMVYLILAAFVALTAATLVLTPTFSQAQEQGSLSDTFSGDRAEELVTGIDELVAREGVGERTLLLRLGESWSEHQRSRCQRNEGG